MEINLFMPRSKSEVCDVAWLLVWKGICQCKKRRLVTAALVISQRQLHECVQQTLLPHHLKLSSARPITNCLATLNGVCTKTNTTRFELLLIEKEVKNSSQT